MSEEIARIVISLVAVLGMIGGGALIAKRMGFAAPGGALGGKKRLSVVETMALDARRRVAIIKCDDTEHLIMLGASGETLVAADIRSDAGAITASETAPAPEAMVVGRTETSTQNAA